MPTFMRHVPLFSLAHPPARVLRSPPRASHATGPRRTGSFPLRFRVLSSAAPLSPGEQLRRLSELDKRVAGENSKVAKAGIIGEYPELRELLEQVYDPTHRTHLSSASLRSYVAHRPPRDGPGKAATDVPQTLQELFDLLNSRSVTGNAAKDLVVAFFTQHDIPLVGLDRPGAELSDVFGKLLDRNLVAGFGARTLLSVKWGDAMSSPRAPPPQTRTPSPTIATSASSPSSTSVPSRSLRAFSCALGQSAAPPFDSLFKADSRWFVSRKLDGVRCIAYLDFALPPSASGTPSLVNTAFLSRTGKPFSALSNLVPQLRFIERYPHLDELLQHDDEVGAMEQGHPIKRLVLDGEVCVMVPRDKHESAPSAPGSGVSSPLWSGSALKEDFPLTVSEIRRKNHNIARPAYYIFDLLSWAEFSAGESLDRQGLGKEFASRQEDLRGLSDWLAKQVKEDYVAIRALNQVPVSRAEEIEAMLDVAAQEGWEGLIIRADGAYKGKRSSDVRKVKRWQDAEYTVVDVEVSRQRLSINGEYAERDAAAAVLIQHKGHQVAVGSGLSAVQRVQWAEDPKRIVGKQITVQYFSESEKVGREGTPSLRFPRLKAVWEGGKRDV